MQKAKYTVQDEIMETLKTLREMTGLNLVVGENNQLVSFGNRMLKAEIVLKFKYASPKAQLQAMIDMRDLIKLATTRGRLVKQ